ncbi:MAG: phosphoribosylanthranilate isomerase [Cruoricaptor ignavus]|nr:phosphoribosylanthranilate isomerase [Cruoricaptor ignavus]
MKLKVCGLTDLSQIEILTDLGVDFLGFIFYEKSPRFVLNHLSLKEINNISHRGKVGVFVNENIDDVVKISEEAGLNFIQLHGDENSKYIEELREKINPGTKIIQVYRISDFAPKIETENIDYLLFDTDSKAFGGTGKSFDWKIINQLNLEKPYLLSGGVSTENYNDIKILSLKPFALDINSKFEIKPGMKDLQKIKQFVTENIKNYEL